MLFPPGGFLKKRRSPNPAYMQRFHVVGDPELEPWTSSLSAAPGPETGDHERALTGSNSLQMSLFDTLLGEGR